MRPSRESSRRLAISDNTNLLTVFLLALQDLCAISKSIARVGVVWAQPLTRAVARAESPAAES